jgi:uncharacterized membrane protein
MTDEQIDNMTSMYHNLINQHTVLIILNCLALLAISLLVIAGVNVWRDVRRMLKKVQELLILTEIHGEASDRNRQGFRDTTEKLKLETTHVVEAVEDAKTRILDVKADTKEIKEVILDGQSKPQPPAEPSK